MNIIDHLKTEHKQLIAVMDQLSNNVNDDSDKFDPLFQEFKKIFSHHDQTEDNIVYSALVERPEFKKIIKKSYQAHHIVQMGILELRLLGYMSDTWGPKFLVIRDSILTHIKEEEEKLFPKMEEMLTEDELVEMRAKAMQS